MEKGIHLTPFRRPFPGQGLGLIFQQFPVFRVGQNDRHRLLFHGLQGLLLLILAPGGAEKLADLVAAGAKHGGQSPKGG